MVALSIVAIAVFGYICNVLNLLIAFTPIATTMGSVL